jgi:phage shock protein B
MTPALIVAIVFGGLVLALAIVCGTILMAMKLRHGGISRHRRQRRAEEDKMIQDIYRGLSKMESRVEALETLLMERHRKERQS